MENIIIPPKTSSLTAKTVICPCCGHKFEGSLFDGCPSCESQAVGEPLARPEIELATYGRSLFVGVIGGLLLLTFFVFTFIAHLERPSFDLNFWSVLSSMEVAAWRLKWMAVPLSILSVWVGYKLCKSIRLSPQRFMWSKLAHSGLLASIAFAILVFTSIGITIPERLRQRQRGFDAEKRAKLYLIDKALFAYRVKYGTLPTNPGDLKNLPDNDGSIALVLSYLEQGQYNPTSQIAQNAPTIPTPKVQIRKTNLETTDPAPIEKIEYTNYEVRIAGEDRIYGNEDDLIIRDGIVTKAEPLTSDQIPTTLKRIDKK